MDNKPRIRGGARRGLAFKLGPAAHYQHDHPPINNVNNAVLSLGQRVADRVASTVGGWPFIIIQSVILMLWIALNIFLVMHGVVGFVHPWDPYPFILLNLVLSFQAAYTGPIVMMSQNRQSEVDRAVAQSAYECNLRAEEEIKVVMEHLAHQDALFKTQAEMLEEILIHLDPIHSKKIMHEIEEDVK